MEVTECLLLFFAEYYGCHFVIKNIKIKIYRGIILPVGMYGCETWSPTLREESKLRIFENGVLRKIFELNRDEVRRQWRRIHKQ
jgi:hypothetical protein